MKKTKQHLTGLFSFLFSLAIVGIITLTFNAGTVYAKTSSKDLISITYKSKNGKIATLNPKYNGSWSSSKKGDYYRYNENHIVKEGDKIILKYKNNVTKKLVARYIFVYDVWDSHLGLCEFQPARAFIDPESEANSYNYFVKNTQGGYENPGEDVYVYSEKDVKNGDITFLSRLVEDDLKITSKQSYKNRWVGGKTYKCTIEFLGKKTEVPVKIKKSKIKKITFEPVNEIVFKKQEGGSWEDGHNGECTLWRTDSEYPEFYEYDIDSKLWENGNKITIEYANHTKKVYTCKNGKYLDKKGIEQPYWISTNINQSYKTRLRTGKDKVFKLFILNKAAKFTVKVVENDSVASISLVPNKPIVLSKEKDAYDNGYFSVDSYLYREGNKLTVNFTDGTKKVYTCHDGSFADSKGKKIYYKDIRVKTSQHEKEWVAGNTYYATVYYHGKTITLPIKITK